MGPPHARGPRAGVRAQEHPECPAAHRGGQSEAQRGSCSPRARGPPSRLRLPNVCGFVFFKSQRAPSGTAGACVYLLVSVVQLNGFEVGSEPCSHRLFQNLPITPKRSPMPFTCQHPQSSRPRSSLLSVSMGSSGLELSDRGHPTTLVLLRLAPFAQHHVSRSVRVAAGVGASFLFCGRRAFRGVGGRHVADWSPSAMATGAFWPSGH